MVRKFNEIGINILTRTQKESNEILKDFKYYKVNALLFNAQQRFAIKEVAVDVLNQLIKLGIECRDIDCKPRYQPYKDDILKGLRERVVTLKNYINTYNATSKDEISVISKTIAFELSNSIKIKEAFLRGEKGIEDMSKKIENNKHISKLLEHKIRAYNINVKQFEKAQAELIELIHQTYSIAI